MEGATRFRIGPCERARQWSSLRLDEELSEVERGLLERHLAVCAECARFAAAVAATTDEVRAALLETPARRWAARSRAAAPPRRGRVLVALVAAALLLGVLFGSLRDRPSAPPEEPATEIGLLTEDPSQLRDVPRTPQREAPRPRDDQQIPVFPPAHT
jgi:ferric-dicitrate binding protein FerR (iron transport regulator)